MKTVLFVCTQNAGRSQIAEALFNRLAPDDVRAESAGQQPRSEGVWPAVIEVLRELGIDVSRQRPRKLRPEMQLHADWAITLACGATCPYVPTFVEDWDVPDPAGKSVDEVRLIRDQIELRVRDLLEQRLDAIRSDRTSHQLRLSHPARPDRALPTAARRRDPGMRRCGARRLRRGAGAVVRDDAGRAQGGRLPGRRWVRGAGLMATAQLGRADQFDERAPGDDRPELARRALMEGIGTFALVFAGCGAIIADATHDGALGAVGVSLVFGLIIMVMIYAGGHLSGAHYNPSVTLAFTLARHFPPRDAITYTAAQLAGAVAGALLLRAAWTDAPADLGATLPSVAAGTALLYEIVLTAFLMFVITAVATDTRAVGAAAAIAIGGTVALDALFGGPVTGASMNPARSFGPALVAGQWSEFWIYVVGPVVGAAIGVLAYELVRGDRRSTRASVCPRG